MQAKKGFRNADTNGRFWRCRVLRNFLPIRRIFFLNVGSIKINIIFVNECLEILESLFLVLPRKA
jgi:hypothetical protein